MERKLLETQLWRFPCAQTQQAFHSPFPKQNRLDVGAAASREGKAKSTSAENRPTLKHPLVSFEFHQILQKQTTCRPQNTPEDVARDLCPTESHNCVCVCVTTQKGVISCKQPRKRDLDLDTTFKRIKIKFKKYISQQERNKKTQAKLSVSSSTSPTQLDLLHLPGQSSCHCPTHSFSSPETSIFSFWSRPPKPVLSGDCRGNGAPSTEALGSAKHKHICRSEALWVLTARRMNSLS